MGNVTPYLPELCIRPNLRQINETGSQEIDFEAKLSTPFDHLNVTIMNLHKVVANLIEAQNTHNSVAYAECFSENAVVFDEGKTHKGKAAIRKWIENSNQQYQTVLKPVSYTETKSETLLKAEVSGTFHGSPATLQFHLGLQNGLIRSLAITG